MQLVIDIGNTRLKAAVFEKKELIKHFVFDSTEDLFKSNLFKTYSPQKTIVCSVVNDIEPFLTQLKDKAEVILFTSQTPVPLKNNYQSANTLGSDRMAAAVGGNSLMPDNDILVIDAGTCIKYNFVNSKNEYLGGGISPGLKMRFEALHTFTARLPLLEPDMDYSALVGRNTQESILSGAELGALAEVEGFIGQYLLKYPNLKVFITGGDMNFFEKRLKNTIFADQHLILKGLNAILNYNTKADH
ncbi:MAG: type III pantothenate kinase [Bacteroidetes bacterium]|nr:type III pantothenate kinase [Bacteroidota bacterium]